MQGDVVEQHGRLRCAAVEEVVKIRDLRRQEGISTAHVGSRSYAWAGLNPVRRRGVELGLPVLPESRKAVPERCPSGEVDKETVLSRQGHVVARECFNPIQRRSPVLECDGSSTAHLNGRTLKVERADKPVRRVPERV